MNVLEWSINNFTYWDKNVHQKQIECPASDFTYCPQVILYPRGLSGHEECLVVHIIGLTTSTNLLTGHMSFIDSSGGIICKKNIDEKEREEHYYELLPRLKFDEVVAQIRKNKVLHHDRLILRCELRWNFDVEYRLYTTIDVYDACVKTDCKIFEELGYKKYILNIQCPIDNCERKFMYLCVTLEKMTFLITLKNPLHYESIFIVTTEVSVLNNDTLIRTENNKHIFYDGASWPFFTSMTKKEMEGKDFTLLLRIKIISSNKYKHHCGYFTRHSKVVDLMPVDCLTQNISGVPEDFRAKSLDSATSIESDNSVAVLSKELMCLYQDHDFSDFQLRCGEVSFPTHKNILSARSPVFKAMLSSGMRESTSDFIDIPDLDVQTTALFLEFLYTGTVDNLQWESALKLYYAADKYQVLTLKRECFSVLHKSVSISNVCDILSLADKHGDVDLTARAHSFILKNYNGVLRSEEWKSFMQKEPFLAVKTVTNFAEKNIFRVFSDS